MKKIITLLLNIIIHFIRREALKIGRKTQIELRKVVFNAGCFLQVGENSNINASIRFDKDKSKIIIGNRTYIGNSLIVASERVTIGDDVLIAWGCTIVDHNSHSVHWGERQNDVLNWNVGKKDWKTVKMKPVIISDKVWIGFNTIILKGVSIGEGAVIGAGSVVTGDVPPFTIYAGNPARLIREIKPGDRPE
jgi:acetyltransferase-like isoleucine patch superfamily enzyme